MRYQGREIDPIALWEQYVEFPPNMEEGKYLPLVRCPNPDHDTQKRHFQINVEDGLVHCFAQCGISGTFEKAISQIEGCNGRQARKIILGFRVQSKPGRVSSRSTKAVRHVSVPHKELLAFQTYIPPAGIEYLRGRGFGGSEIARWEMGWDSEAKRIVIPAKDEKGVTRFLIKRAVFESQYPKYLYAPEGVHKNSLLFGAGQIDPEMVRSQGVILVEGSFDCIRLRQYEFSNTVATLGTGISDDQRMLLSRLRPRRVYLFFDRDVAGIRGIEIARRKLAGLPLYVCLYPKERSDPSECSRKEVERAVSRAVSIFQFNRRARERSESWLGTQ